MIMSEVGRSYLSYQVALNDRLEAVPFKSSTNQGRATNSDSFGLLKAFAPLGLCRTEILCTRRDSV